MKTKLLFMAMLMTSLVFLNSCKDDEPAAKLEFTFDGESYSLKGANLYLTSEALSTNRTHHTLFYYITDGAYLNNNFQNYTYLLEVEIGTLLANDFEAGEYPQHSNWLPDERITTNIGYIFFVSGTENEYVEYYTEDANNDFSPVIVSGGLDNGETMTIKFSGTLGYSYDDGTTEIEKAVTGKFYFKGKVNDQRPI